MNNFKSDHFLYAIYGFVGYLFFKSGYAKVAGGEFAAGLNKTLSAFASKNPHLWYKQFLLNVAIPNSELFAILTMMGEVLTGLGLMVSALLYWFVPNHKKLSLVALLLSGSCGMFLNIIFWFAAGWMSQSTNTVNLLMAFINLTAIVFSGTKLFSPKK